MAHIFSRFCVHRRAAPSCESARPRAPPSCVDRTTCVSGTGSVDRAISAGPRCVVGGGGGRALTTAMNRRSGTLAPQERASWGRLKRGLRKRGRLLRWAHQARCQTPRLARWHRQADELALGRSSARPTELLWPKLAMAIGADDPLWHSLDPKRNTEREGALEKLIPTLNSNDRRRHGGGDLKAQSDRSRRLLVVDTPESLPKVDAVFCSGLLQKELEQSVAKAKTTADESHLKWTQATAALKKYGAQPAQPQPQPHPLCAPLSNNDERRTTRPAIRRSRRSATATNDDRRTTNDERRTTTTDGASHHAIPDVPHLMYAAAVYSQQQMTTLRAKLNDSAQILRLQLLPIKKRKHRQK